MAADEKRIICGNRAPCCYSVAHSGVFALWGQKWSQTRIVEFRRAALQEHKYQIGETVYFTSRRLGHMAANSTYRIVRLLPSDGADYQYRIKNQNEAFERVARESQLDHSP